MSQTLIFSTHQWYIPKMISSAFRHTAMIYQFGLGVAIAFFLAAFNFPQLSPQLLSSLSPVYADGFPGLALLFLRVSLGWLFILHGYLISCTKKN
jgi:hypothetical protein